MRINPLLSIFRHGPTILFCVVAILSNFVIFSKISLSQMDLAGHLASAWKVHQGLWHHYILSIFSGSVQGLFYPPLEDFILAGLLHLPVHPVVVFKSYLILIWSCFILQWAWVSRQFTTRLAQWFFCIALMTVLFTQKENLLQDQGLGFIDLFVTGLTSEFLGALFLMEYLRRWFRKTDSLASSTLLMSGTIASHIVVSLVFGIIVIAQLVTEPKRRKHLLLAGTFSLAITAGYWVPFLAYRSFIASSLITRSTSLTLFLLAIPLWFFVSKKTRILLGIGIGFAGVQLLGEWSFTRDLLPSFHYYRLTIFFIFAWVFGLTLILDRTRIKILRLGIAGTGLLLVFIIFKGGITDFLFKKIAQKDIKDTAIHLRPYRVPQDLGRTLVIGDYRSADFGIDSLLMIQDPHFKSTKGLFWESSKNNMLQSSYLSTLLTPPMVLDYYYFKGYSCEIQNCLLDTYIRRYAVQQIVSSPHFEQRYLPLERQVCYRTWLQSQGTTHYGWSDGGAVFVEGSGLRVLNLVPKTHESSRYFQLVETIAPDQIRGIEIKNSMNIAERIRSDFYSCESARSTSSPPRFLFEMNADQHAKLFSHQPALDRTPSHPLSAEVIRLIPSHPDVLRFNVSDSQPKLTIAKVSDLPGLVVQRKNGEVWESIPHFTGIGFIVFWTHGETRLTYIKPILVRIAEGVSLFTVLIGILGLLIPLLRPRIPSRRP